MPLETGAFCVAGPAARMPQPYGDGPGRAQIKRLINLLSPCLPSRNGVLYPHRTIRSELTRFLHMANTGTRERSVKRLFLNEGSAEPAGRSDVNTKGLIFVFPNDEKIEIALADFSPGILNAAAAFGLNTSLGNAANTAKEEDGSKATPETMREAVEARLEVLKSGKWASDAVGGSTRPSMLYAAVLEHRTKTGKATDDATMSAIRDTLRADEDKAAKLAKFAPIAEILERMRAERRAANATTKADEVSDILA